MCDKKILCILSPPPTTEFRHLRCRQTVGRRSIPHILMIIICIGFIVTFSPVVKPHLFLSILQEITPQTLIVWFCLDYCADFVYLIDIGVHFRTGYLEDGVLQTDSTKLRHHYMNSTTFYIDCLCLLPLDFLYLSIGFNSILRCFRLVRENLHICRN